MNPTTNKKFSAWRNSLLLLATCLMAGCDQVPSSADAATQKGAGEFADVRRDAAVVAIERVMPSVVNIRTTQLVRRNDAYETIFRRFYGLNDNPQVQEVPSDVGSGVIVDVIGDDGYILTNVHVVQRANRVQVQLWDGREYDAEPLLATSQKDLALYRITRRKNDKPFQPIAIAKDDDLLLGETVLAVGNPFGLGGSISRGILSSKNRRADSGGQKLNYADWLQTDADINPGNSGGPLINLNGELIGINVAVVGQNEGKGTGFAIPVKQISAALSDFFSLEWTAKLWLGARLRGAPYALTVREVQQNSPAYRAGMRVGQQVLEVNGKAVKGLGDFNLYMNQKPDHRAEVVVSESGRKKTLNIEMIPMEDLQRQMIFSRLGLRTQRLTGEQAKAFELNEKAALVVTEVEKSSPAESAGLKPGMVILDVDGENFFDQITATNVLGNKKPGERAVLRFKVPTRLANGFVEVREARVEIPVR